jgi:hypothetical protein
MKTSLLSIPRTAIVPAAGLGTRFLPATKTIPKELLPVVDTPGIELVAAEAGAERLVIVTSAGKDGVVAHFVEDLVSEGTLEARGKHVMLEKVRRAPALIKVESVVQREPLGLGHAVLCVEPVLSPDEDGVADRRKVGNPRGPHTHPLTAVEHHGRPSPKAGQANAWRATHFADGATLLEACVAGVALLDLTPEQTACSHPHWHRQHYGPDGRSQTRRIRIAPFMVNTGAARRRPTPDPLAADTHAVSSRVPRHAMRFTGGGRRRR